MSPKIFTNEEEGMPENNSAGKSVESYCGKCKVNSDHTVMTTDGEAIARVRCKTCGVLHKYRDPAVPPKGRKAGAKTAAREGAATTLIWEAGLAAAKGKERDYDRAALYRVGEVVNHRTFGKGIVLKIHTNKCDMLFEDKERLMASANQ
jgi:hypothetical protein